MAVAANRTGVSSRVGKETQRTVGERPQQARPRGDGTRTLAQCICASQTQETSGVEGAGHEVLNPALSQSRAIH